MNALTLPELEHFVSFYAPLLQGSQLQDIVTNDRGLALGFQGDRRYWFVIDLVPQTPMVMVFEEFCPVRKGAKPKPVGLFLNSNAKNLYFSSLEIVAEMGRVLRLVLKNSLTTCELEIRLIPKQCNLIVKFEKKQISWERPFELGPSPVPEKMPEPRDLEALKEMWLAQQKGSQKSQLDPKAQWEKQKNKDLEKKRKALGEIEKQILSPVGDEWSQAGQWLKASGTLEGIPEEMQRYLNFEESLSWNIENAFSKSKQQIAKKAGARERFDALTLEIQKLEKTQFSAKSAAKPLLTDLMKKAEARGRKMTLESGVLAYCGKSAADNLALLRQAKAWDYWLHLKDYPGAHAIIHRQRDQQVGDGDIQKVAEWVARESLASSRSLDTGQKVNVVIVECRFVRPIKGDKLGRVTFHSEKTLSFILK